MGQSGSVGSEMTKFCAGWGGGGGWGKTGGVCVCVCVVIGCVGGGWVRWDGGVGGG